MLDEILRSCRNDTKLCIACNLTADDELIQTKSIGDWKKEHPDLHKKPTIFLLYRNR
jgi:16S rRNA (cytidine1402-2'-O)-methyltransferase